MKELSRDQLTDLAWGACLLSGGGGGPLATAEEQIENLPADFKVRLVSVKEAAASGKLTAVVGYYGEDASKIGGQPTPAVDAFRHLSADYDGKIGHTIPFETGAVSSIVPCLVAGLSGAAVVDADGAGRSIGTLAMTTFARVKPSAAPGQVDAEAVWGNDASSRKEFVAASAGAYDQDMDSLLRSPSVPGLAGAATWPMDGPTLKRAAPIRGTLSLAVKLGALLRRGKKPVDRVVAKLNRGRRRKRAFKLFTGIVEEAPSELQGVYRFVFRRRRRRVRVQMGTIGWINDDALPLAVWPDAISYVTASGRPFTNLVDFPTIAGQRATVLGIRAHKALLRPSPYQELRQWVLRTGYSGAYVPVNKLRKRRKRRGKGKR